jgi:hypothetical protein
MKSYNPEDDSDGTAGFRRSRSYATPMKKLDPSFPS